MICLHFWMNLLILLSTCRELFMCRMIYQLAIPLTSVNPSPKGPHFKVAKTNTRIAMLRQLWQHLRANCATDFILWTYDIVPLGVGIFEGVRVEGVDVEGGRVTGVRTDKGTINCEIFVNCAGQVKKFGSYAKHLEAEEKYVVWVVTVYIHVSVGETAWWIVSYSCQPSSSFRWAVLHNHEAFWR